MPIVHWVSRLVRDTPIEQFTRRLYLQLMPGKFYQYERDINRIIKRALKTGMNAIDVGAFRGSVLAEIIRMAPDGQHYAFEPLPEHYRYLVKHFPNVNVLPFALGDVTGQAPFYHVVHRPTLSGLREIKILTDQEIVEEISVEVRRLDDLLAADHWIHFMKIDVEGGEFAVLKGAQSTLARCKPLVVFEHCFTSEWYFQHPSGEVFDMLEKGCQLRINTLNGWLQNSPALARQQFIDLASQGEEFYFVAYDPGAKPG